MSLWLDNSSNSNNIKQSYVHGFLDVSGGNVNIRSDNNLNIFSETDTTISRFTLSSDEVRVYDNATSSFVDLSNNKLQYIKDVSENVQTRLTDLTSRTQKIRTTIGGDIEVSANIIPSVANTINLGSVEKPFGSIYLNSSTLHFIGDDNSESGAISIDTTGEVYINKGSNNERRLINQSKSDNNKTKIGFADVGGDGTSLDVSGHAYFRDNVRIIGDLDVSGDINFLGEFIQKDTVITVTEQMDLSNNGTGPALIVRQHGSEAIASFYDDNEVAMIINDGGDVSMNMKLNVGGNTEIDGTTTVSGATILSSTLNVSNTTTLSSNAIVSGDVSMNSKLSVGSDVSLNSNVDVAGDVNVSGTTILSSTLNVSNTATMSSNAIVSGDVSLNSKLSVGSDVSLNSNVDVAGDVNVSGATTLTSTLNISNTATMSSNAIVSGDVSLNSKLSVGSDVSLNNDLDVAGDVNVSGVTILTSTLNVSNTATMSSNAIVSGDVSLNSKLSVGGDVSLNNDIDVAGDVNVSGATILTSTLNVSNTATMSSNAIVSGDVSLNSKLSVGGDVSLNSNVDIEGNMVVSGNITGNYPTESIPSTAISGGLPGAVYVSLIDSNGDISNELSVTKIRFDTDSGFAIDNLSNNAVKIKMNSTFKYWNVEGQTSLVAEGLDTMDFFTDGNIQIVTDGSDANHITFKAPDMVNRSSNQYISGIKTFNQIFVVDDVCLNSNLNVLGNVDISGTLDVAGDITGVTDLNVTGYSYLDDVETTGNLGIQTSEAAAYELEVNGTAYATDISAGSSIKVGNTSITSTSTSLSGIPTAPTANSGTNTTQIATTAFVQSSVANLVDSAPEALDTLNELAAALGDDANFSTTITTRLGKVDVSVNALESTTSTHSSNISVLDTSVNALESTTATHTSDVSVLDTSVNALESTTSTHSSNISVLDTSMNALESTTATQTSNISVLDTSVNALESTTTTQTSNISVLDTSVNALESTTATQTSNIGVLDTSVNALESTTETHTSNISALDTSVNALESTTATHSSNISVLDTSVNALESTTATQTSNIGVLDTSVNALESTTETHTSNISALDTSVNALESTTETHTSNISVLDTSVNALESTTATQTSNIGVLDTSVNALESTTATHTSNISVLDTSMNALESTTATHTSNISVLDTSMNALESTTTTQTSNISVLDTSMNALESTTTTQTSNISVLDTSMNALESTTATHTTDISTIDSTLTDISTNVYDMSSNFINRARAAFSSSTGVTITDGDISIPQEIETTSNPTFNNLVLSGNLTVNGTPTAPTASSGTNTTQIATTAFVQTSVANLVDSAPEALDTLNELAAALGDDANFSTTITTRLGKVDVSVNALESTTATHTSNISVLDTSVNALESTTATQTSNISVLDTSVNALESTTATHTSNISVLDTSVNTLESTTSTHTSNISILDTSMNALESTTATHTSNISILDTSMNALESTTATHTSNISVLDTSVNALESTTATHTSNISVLDTSVNALESTTATHTSNISVLDTSVNALESTTATQTSNISVLDTSVNALESTTATHTSNISVLDTSVNALESTTATQTSNISVLDTSVNALESTTSTHTSNISVLDTSVNALESTTATQTSNISVLDTSVNALESTTATHTSDISVLDISMNVLESTTSTHTSNISVLDTSMNALESTTSTHTSNISVLDTSVNALESTTATHTSDISVLYTSKNALESTTSTHTSDISSLNGTVSDLSSNFVTRSRSAVNAGTGVSISNGEISIGQSVATNADVTLNNLILSGNLTVNGNTTTIDTANLDVSDSLIGLSSGLSGAPANDAGILINRGDASNAFMGWDESADKFTMGTTTATSTDTGDLSITKGILVADLEGNVTGNADTVTNGVYTTGNQSIAGDKTFNDLIIANNNAIQFHSLGNNHKYSIGMFENSESATNGKGFSSWAMKFKMADSNTQGFIFSNENNDCLLSIRANDGLTYINGDTGIGFDPTNASYSSYKLSVNGTAYATDISAGTSIKVGQTSITDGNITIKDDVSGGDVGALSLYNTAGTNNDSSVSIKFYDHPTEETGTISNYRYASGDYGLRFNNWNGTNSEHMVLRNGGVGIGTNNPSYKLDVRTTSSSEIVARFGYTGGGGVTNTGSGIVHITGESDAGQAILRFGVPNQVNGAHKTAIIAKHHLGIGSWSRSNLYFCLNDNGNNNSSAQNATIAHAKMTIRTDGKVGIGTIDPSYNLHVNGTAYATDISAGTSIKVGSTSITSTNTSLGGTPTAPTADSGTNTTQIATTQFVTTAVASVAGGTGETTTLAVGTNNTEFTVDASGNVVIQGSLIVSGSGTSTDSGTLDVGGLNVDDNVITITQSSAGSEDMGLYMARDSGNDAFMGWNESQDKFVLGLTDPADGTLNITSTGTLVANLEGQAALTSGSTGATPTTGTNNTSLATTAFVYDAMDASNIIYTAGTGITINSNTISLTNDVSSNVSVLEVSYNYIEDNYATTSTVNGLTTDEISEGSNLYFTDQRVVSAIDSQLQGLRTTDNVEFGNLTLSGTLTVSNGGKFTGNNGFNNVNSPPGVYLGSYGSQYGNIQIVSDQSNGGWIDFTDNLSGSANDFEGRIRYGTSAGFDFFTNNTSRMHIGLNGDVTLGSGLAVGTNNTEFTVDADGSTSITSTLAVSGNVGIGITNPSNTLTINGSKSDSIAALGLRAGNSWDSFTGGQIAFGYDGTNNYQHFINTRHHATTPNLSAMDFFINDTTQANTLASGTTHALTLTGSGNVGIGTTTPDTLLHLYKAGSNYKLKISSENTQLVLGTNDDTDAYLWVPTDHDLRIGTNDIERIRIKNSGNVGIGTTNPSYKLDVRTTTTASSEIAARFGYTGGTAGGTGQGIVHITGEAEHAQAILRFGVPWGVNGAHKTAIIAKHDLSTNNWSRAHLYFCLNDNSDDNSSSQNATTAHAKMIIKSNGSIYMGNEITKVTNTQYYAGYTVSDAANQPQNTIEPYEYDRITLTVGLVDDVSYVTHVSRAGFYNGGFFDQNNARANATHVSIFAEGSVLSSFGFINYSDKRIKKDILTIEDDNALVNFRKLNPCTYSYIDTLKRGSDTVYGFIAQEVKEVLPYACSTRSETVPNVFQMADLSGNFLILQGGTFDNLEHDLTDPSGNVYANISIAIEDTKGENTNFQVKEVVNSTTIELYQELPSDFYIYNESTDKNVCFIFGQFINNFNLLDKNAIWTIAAAATQEIDRQQQADKIRIAELETKVETLETQLTSVLARLTALENA